MLPDFEYRTTDADGYHLRRFRTEILARRWVQAHPGSHLLTVHHRHPWKARVRCATNTPAMLRQIRSRWRQQRLMRGAVHCHFEHGQWWITHIVTGVQSAVFRASSWAICPAVRQA